MPNELNRSRTPDATRTRRNRRTAGFSLIEVLITLLILSLVVSITAPRLIGYLSRAKTQTVAVQIENLEAAVDLFLIDTGRYPTPEEGLDVLITNTKNIMGWSGPYLKDEEVPLDPWGQPYQLRHLDGRLGIEVFSLGDPEEAPSTQ